ncbi:MAG TPA: GNAT family N-acetyltransferase [Blastocatellia bacterium]
MKVRVLGTDRSTEWLSELSALPGSDTYFLPEYHRAHELNGDGSARAFVASDEHNTLFYPFMLRKITQAGGIPIEDDIFDIETVYGYSGPLCSTGDPAFVSAAWSEFSAWCGAQGVIAEFIRFNPLSENHKAIGDACNVGLNRETVVLRLDAADLEATYGSIHRNMIRKATKAGLVAEQGSLDEDLSGFRTLYSDTMRRAGANAYYFFSDAYFETLCDAGGSSVVLFKVMSADKMIAGALFLVYADRLHYHLAGSDPAFRGLAANNLLLHTAAEWGRDRGMRWLHLGGGRRPAGDDSLFKFKASISRRRLQFYTGTRIHDLAGYESLCSQAMIASGRSSGAGYFLRYRL